MRWIARQLYHKDQLCPGARKCEMAKDYSCRTCATEFEDEEDRPVCPDCGGKDILSHRCDSCGLTKFDEVMATWKGRLVGRANDLLFAGSHGISIGEPTLEEFRAMQILESERVKAEIERVERERENGAEEH